MVTGGTVVAPPGVLEAYADVMEGYAKPGKDPVIKGTNSLTGKP
jgi:hypothetical protein